MTAAKPNVRYAEVDMLKGLACVLMLIGHAVRVSMGPPAPIDNVILYIMDFSGPIFFFVSGMNVMTFLERNRDKPGFDAGKFYLAAAAALFFLGYTYNINRVSLNFFDIFQGVAICTAIVFLLMRTKLPTAVHLVIVAAAFLFYTQFRVRLELDQVLPNFSELKAAIPPGADFMTAFQPIQSFLTAMGPLRRALFVHFGLLPWLIYFYVGALCYRSVTGPAAKTAPWWAFFAALFVAGPVVHLIDGGRVFQHMFLDSYLDLMVRGIPSYVLMTLGGAGLAYLFSRKVYKGAAKYTNAAGRFVGFQLERLGKESLMFLVVHWWVIATVMLPLMIIAKRSETVTGVAWTLDVYARAAIVLVAVLFFVPRFARLRDRWSQANRFATKAAVFMGASIFLALLMLPVPPLSNYLTYGSSFGFAFLYPTVRARLRRRYTKPLEQPAA